MDVDKHSAVAWGYGFGHVDGDGGEDHEGACAGEEAPDDELKKSNQLYVLRKVRLFEELSFCYLSNVRCTSHQSCRDD